MGQDDAGGMTWNDHLDSHLLGLMEGTWGGESMRETTIRGLTPLQLRGWPWERGCMIKGTWHFVEMHMRCICVHAIRFHMYKPSLIQWQQSIGLAAPQQFGRSILLNMSRYQLISSLSNPGPFFPLFVSNFVSLWLPPNAVIEHLQQDKCRGRNVCHGHDSLVWHQNMLNPRCNVRDSKNISWKFMENMPMWMYTENIANILHEI